MLQLTRILGFVSDPLLAEQLHTVGHHGGVEFVLLDQADAKRHRLRTLTDRGTDVAIALERNATLSDGAVLYLTETRAIVVRMKNEHWLRFAPVDSAAALELGHLAGHLHWRVRFDKKVLAVACEGPEQTYLDRLHSLFLNGRVRRLDDEHSC